MQNYAKPHEFRPKSILKPTLGIRNAHIQTIFASSELRQLLIKRRSTALLKASESVLLHSSEGVRLQVDISRPQQANGRMALLLHGWEGSSDSAYMLASGQQLFRAGYTVCRLNLRDHGDTHHLNQEPFNSVRLNEVCDAIVNLQQRFQPEQVLMLGFSLGGNFVLRLAGHEKLKEIPFFQSIAVCPAIDPVKSTDAIEQGAWFYHHYFVRRWHGSLRKKYQYYPELMRSHEDLKHKALWQMNRTFVPLHTDFDVTEHYLNAYAIRQQTLDAITHPCHIIYADDDPIISAEDFDTLKETQWVQINAQPYGGHCAFLPDLKLQSWINQLLQEWLRAEPQ